jgi:HTH-type transcriptional regulator/antitoxin HipB
MGINLWLQEETMNHLIATPDQLSHVMRSVRKARKLSQLEVGKTVGLLQKSVSALENHPESATIESLFKLLSALELELIVSPKDSGSGKGPGGNDSGEW